MVSVSDDGVSAGGEHGLSALELEFVRLIVEEGLPVAHAFRRAGLEAASEGAERVAAVRLFRRVDVQGVIARWKSEIAEMARCATVLSVQEKRGLLADIARGEPRLPSGEFFEVAPSHTERMRAFDLDSRLVGDFAAERREVAVQGDFMADLLAVVQGGE